MSAVAYYDLLESCHIYDKIMTISGYSPVLIMSNLVIMTYLRQLTLS